jgi:hypothetical protein
VLIGGLVMRKGSELVLRMSELVLRMLGIIKIGHDGVTNQMKGSGERRERDDM